MPVPAVVHNSITHKPNIRVITKLPNSEQSYKGKVKTHKYINRQTENIMTKRKMVQGTDHLTSGGGVCFFSKKIF
jgi:hypothetical protein